MLDIFFILLYSVFKLKMTFFFFVQLVNVLLNIVMLGVIFFSLGQFNIPTIKEYGMGLSSVIKFKKLNFFSYLFSYPWYLVSSPLISAIILIFSVFIGCSLYFIFNVTILYIIEVFYKFHFPTFKGVHFQEHSNVLDYDKRVDESTQLHKEQFNSVASQSKQEDPQIVTLEKKEKSNYWGVFVLGGLILIFASSSFQNNDIPDLDIFQGVSLVQVSAIVLGALSNSYLFRSICDFSEGISLSNFANTTGEPVVSQETVAIVPEVASKIKPAVSQETVAFVPEVVSEIKPAVSKETAVITSEIKNVVGLNKVNPLIDRIREVSLETTGVLVKNVHQAVLDNSNPVTHPAIEPISGITGSALAVMVENIHSVTATGLVQNNNNIVTPVEQKKTKVINKTSVESTDVLSSYIAAFDSLKGEVLTLGSHHSTLFCRLKYAKEDRIIEYNNMTQRFAKKILAYNDALKALEIDVSKFYGKDKNQWPNPFFRQYEELNLINFFLLEQYKLVTSVTIEYKLRKQILEYWRDSFFFVNYTKLHYYLNILPLLAQFFDQSFELASKEANPEDLMVMNGLWRRLVNMLRRTKIPNMEDGIIPKVFYINEDSTKIEIDFKFIKKKINEFDAELKTFRAIEKKNK